MAAALKGGVQPGVHNLHGQHGTHHTGAQGHHIGVVVLAGEPGGHLVREQGAADALDLVGGDGCADAGGAQHDPAVTFPGGHRLGSGRYKIRVVAAGFPVGAKVLVGESPCFQMLLHRFLERVGAVVACNGNHNSFLLFPVSVFFIIPNFSDHGKRSQNRMSLHDSPQIFL